MTTLEKLVDISVVDVISIPAALIAVALLTGGLNIGGVIGVIVGNRICRVLAK